MVRILFLLVAAFCAAACRVSNPSAPTGVPAAQVTGQPSQNLQTCVANYDPATDYFPEQVEFRHSTQLQVSYHKHYKVVTFSPSVATQEILRYVLVQCGAPVPTGYGKAQTIQVPAGTFVTSDAKIGSVILSLGLLDRLRGVGNQREYSLKPILDRLDRGELEQVGGGTHSNIEMVLGLRPDLYFTFYSAYPSYNMHPKLWEVGIKAAPLSAHTETTPLGNSEWMKYVALFFNKEGEANRQFAPIVAAYNQLAQRARNVENRPEVMLGAGNSRDEWALAGGRNHHAQLIYDAGGQYFWRDDIAGSLVLANYERVFALSGEATFWVTSPYSGTRLSGLSGFDPRVKYIRAVRDRNVHGWLGESKIPFRYPFNDQTLDKPHVLLADLMSILHPDLIPSHERVYLRRLEH